MNVLRNNKGLSIVEGLLAVAIVGATALSLGYVYSRTIQSVAVVDTSRDVLYVHSGVLSKMRQILLDVNDPATGKNTLGLCRLMTTDALGYGIGEIKVDFDIKKIQSALRESSGEDRWVGRLGPEWVPLDPKDCEGHNEFRRCFAPSKSMDQDGSFKGVSDIRLIAEVTPVDLSPEKEKPFAEITSYHEKTGKAAIDAKRVAFFLDSKITYKKRDAQGEERPYENQNREIVWAADVNSCYYKTASGEHIDMYPSGVGLGDSEGRVLFNNPDFFKNVVQDPLKDSGFKRIIVQEGVVDDAGFIRTDSQKNVEMACTEASYRCFNRNSQRVFSSRVNADLDIVYSNGYNGANHSLVNMTPRFSVQKDRAGANLLSKEGVSHEFLLAGLQYGKHSDGRYYEIESETQQVNLAKPMRLLPTTNVFNVEARDNQGGMCAQICPSSTSRETPPAYFAKLDVTLHKLFKSSTSGQPEDYSSTLSSTAPIACIVCYAKNCNRLGLATFGRMDQQPDEPIDSGLPECALNDKTDEDLSFTDIGIPSGQSNKCLAAQISKGSTKIKYVPRDCNDNLPIMCYGYGRFAVATDVGVNQSSWAERSFFGAQRRCYEMGQETLRKDKLEEMFAQAPATLDTSLLAEKSINNETYYQYLNNAAQGIFLAPQSVRQQVGAIETLLGSVSFPTEKWFWVAMQTDASGFPIATVPLMQTRDDQNEKSALYFDGNIPKLKEFAFDNFSSKFAAPQDGFHYALLSHHVRFKGVVSSARNIVEAAPFLCREKNGKGFFKSTSRSRNFMDGYDICMNENGAFLPPLTSMQWVRAFELAAPFAGDFAYPDPEKSAGLLWVGAVSTNSFRDYFVPTSANSISGNSSYLSRLGELYQGNKTGRVNSRGQYRAEQVRALERECRDERVSRQREVSERDSFGNIIKRFVTDWFTESKCEDVWKVKQRSPDYRICHNSDGSSFSLRRYSDGCGAGMIQVNRTLLENSVVAQSWWVILTYNLRLDRYNSENEQTVELL